MLSPIQIGLVLLKHSNDFPNIVSTAVAAEKALTTLPAEKIDPLCTALQAWKPIELDLIAAAQAVGAPQVVALFQFEAEGARLGVDASFVSQLWKFIHDHPELIAWILSMFSGKIPVAVTP